MARVDRSEELYAKIAAIPPRRRAFYNLLAIIPIFIFIVGFYIISISCGEDRRGALVTAIFIILLLNCVAINGSLLWLLASHPRISRSFAALSPAKRLMVICCLTVSLIILKPLFMQIFDHLVFDHLDRIHAQRCDGRNANRYAAAGQSEIFERVTRGRAELNSN